MSRSNPTNTNPATRFFQWSGSKGMLLWYDKSQEKNIEQKLPFEFLVLDELSTITGYNKQMEAGFWSNEVRNTTKDEMFVRTKQGPFEAGLYANLTQTRSKGGKYAKSIYIAYKEGGEWVIANIKASGSCLSAWIDFSNNHATETGKITMSRGEAADAPTGQYFPPVFTWGKASPEEDSAAKELDRQLQTYLNQYMAVRRDEEGREIETDVPAAAPLATPEQTADFERRKQEAAGKPVPTQQVDDVIIEDIGDEPINLDDIPF